MAAGVSQRTLAAAAPYLVYSQDIVNRDRGQRVFGQAFVEFSDRMAAAYRMQQGQAKIKAHANAFARAEQHYGVPAPVIAAFWGLESDFGANMGKLSTLTSLASLAYDCRRAAMFREELISALKVVERGDLQPGEMIGSWAGELGQTQFLATLYEKFAVDGDGDGRRDLLRSPADVILSTANYIASLGWKRGEPWLTEVRVAANVPWVPGVPFPERALGLKGPVFVGLTETPERLIELRKSRLKADPKDPRHANNSYLDPVKLEEEVKEARRFFAKHGWPVIDVTRRSVEETAAEIQIILQRRRTDKNQTELL